MMSTHRKSDPSPFVLYIGIFLQTFLPSMISLWFIIVGSKTFKALCIHIIKDDNMLLDTDNKIILYIYDIWSNINQTNIIILLCYTSMASVRNAHFPDNSNRASNAREVHYPLGDRQSFTWSLNTQSTVYSEFFSNINVVFSRLYIWICQRLYYLLSFLFVLKLCKCGHSN